MLVTPSGIIILVRDVQPLNAPSPIDVTDFPLYSFGIIISLSVAVPIPVTV